MNTYLLTSTHFSGQVTFQFNDNDVLLKYDVTEATLTDQQLNWIASRLPKTLPQLQEVLKKAPNAKLTKITVSGVTFQQFWDRYNEKTRSSKKKAQTTWNRLPQGQRDAAYHFIPKYERSIPPGVAKKYAETYLNAELWNN